MNTLKQLISESLSRHGITKEVTAHLVVKEARAILEEILPSHAKADIEVRSFRKSQLRIACAHSVALSTLRQYESQLKEQLIKQVPRMDLARIMSFVDTRSNDGS